MAALDWTVIRFWGSEIKKDLEGCLKVIEEAAFEKMISDTYSTDMDDDVFEPSE